MQLTKEQMEDLPLGFTPIPKTGKEKMPKIRPCNNRKHGKRKGKKINSRKITIQRIGNKNIYHYTIALKNGWPKNNEE